MQDSQDKFSLGGSLVENNNYTLTVLSFKNTGYRELKSLRNLLLNIFSTTLKKSISPNHKTLAGEFDPLKIERLDAAGLGLDSPYIQLALHKDLIALTSVYFSQIPILAGIHVWHTDQQNFSVQSLSETQVFTAMAMRRNSSNFLFM